MRVSIFFSFRGGAMLRRKAEETLRQWADSDSRKCLMIRGARQVGKTFLADRLGEQFNQYVRINFLETSAMAAIFSGNLDVETLLMNFSVYMPTAKFEPGKTLLFLDEIQECPEAITSLKFWAQDGRFKVLVSGSMLGIDYKRPSSYPVGAVEYLDMTSLDFEEYLWALGVSEAVTAHLRDCFEKCLPVAPPIHDQMMRNLRTYLVTGGMPEAVSIYIERNSMAETDQKLRTILTDYRYDIAHYASADIKLKAEKCYFSLPEQLAKANHKFQYSIVEKGGNARKYGSSVDWLRNAYLTVECRNVTNLEMPLAAHQDMTQFRLYPTDIGLLTSMYDYPFKALLLSSGQQAALQAKGGVYEALIAEMLYKRGHRGLFFRKNEQATFEIEYLLEREEGIVPIEVKSGRSRSRSLDRLLEREEIPYGYKLIDGNVGRAGKKITLPLYMAMFL